jgi:exoribonuclease-2
MRQRGLEPEFPAAALAQVGAVRRAAVDASADDLRALLWCSIDNDDSRDLDQLTAAEPLAGERTRIRVAVADVDALVERGSPVDAHAQHNTTSVYTAAGIFPMLPEKLSTDLTSLVQDEDRLAIVAEMVVDGDGAVTASGFRRALVRNKAKLAYDGVAAWLTGEGPAPPRLAAVPGLAANVELQDRVAQALRSRRQERGALSLDTVEARAVFEDGRLADLRAEPKNRARELIEDMMIAANGATARFLDDRRSPSLRRVLRTPERWDRIAQMAAEAGGSLPPEPDAVALEAFLRRQREADPESFPDLSLSIVKLMGSGEYAVNVPGHPAPGHFGLAVRDYAHSTAPNRRFPDLLTQRLVKAALAAGPLPYQPDELIALAKHCTEAEDNGAKVERQVRKSAAALLLADRVGEVFDAIVTGASHKGTWVRALRPPVEGRVVQGFEGLDVGDRVRVELIETDVERGYIDFAARRSASRATAGSRRRAH